MIFKKILIKLNLTYPNNTNWPNCTQTDINNNEQAKEDENNNCYMQTHFSKPNSKK